MSKLERRLFAGIVLAIVIYVAFALVADIRDVGESLSRFKWSALAVGFALASTNYVLRVMRWLLYLDALELRVPRGRAILCFFAGFAMTISPGKIGEVLKSYLLKRSDDIPVATTAPIVIAERLTDVLALLALVVVGVGAYAAQITSASDGPFSPLAALAIVAGVSVAGTLALSHQPTVMATIRIARRLPVVGRWADRLEHAYTSMRALLRPSVMARAVALAGLAWFLEGYALWIIARGFPGAEPSIGPTVFVYGLTTLLGAFSFLPGGLGVTEGTMGVLLERMRQVPDLPAAVGATYLIRLATLWFAVVIGVFALGAYRVRYLDADETLDL